MIPYGIYVLTANGDEGLVAATVNWLTQTSFESPLIAVVLKHDCYSYASVDKNSNFTLNKRCKGQQGLAVGFFKPSTVEGNLVSGELFQEGFNGAPVLDNVPTHVEYKMAQIVELGDHYVVIGEMIYTNVSKQPEGRADEAILEIKELGDNGFYGG